MATGDPEDLEFKEAVLQALDIPGRTEQLEVFKIMLDVGDYFPAGSLLGEEADHLKKISEMILKWEKLSREQTEK